MKYKKLIYKLKNFLKPSSLKRKISLLSQRLINGWDDSDTYSLDHSLANLILPRLKRFKELQIGHPCNMTSQEWSGIVDEMIWAMEYFASGKQWEHCYTDKSKLEYDRAQAGLNLFAKYYIYLWW